MKPTVAMMAAILAMAASAPVPTFETSSSSEPWRQRKPKASKKKRGK